ncbi:MAG: hypothetical protein HZA93_18695 [Verrucomicrobia bacterium]|nr:hypothetical protein [Verrucomicrobiota bacterium]
MMGRAFVPWLPVRYTGNMALPQWLTDNWFTALQSFAIVSGFVFTSITLRRDERTRRIGNLFKLTASHRELWSQFFVRPGLRRVMSKKADLSLEPVTEDESLFVRFLILHINSAHHAIKYGLMDAPDGFDADLSDLFANPIPRAVWQSLRHFQDRDFIEFVESHFPHGGERVTEA